MNIRILIARTAMFMLGAAAIAAPAYILIMNRVFTSPRYPNDQHTVTEKRFAPIRKALPRNAVAGYMNGNDTPFVDDTDLIAAAYYLTPSILIKLTNSDQYEYLLIDSKTNVHYPANSYTVIASSEGLTLYRRSGK